MTGPAIYYSAGGLSVRPHPHVYGGMILCEQPSLFGRGRGCRSLARVSVGAQPLCEDHGTEAHIEAIKEAIMRKRLGE